MSTSTITTYAATCSAAVNGFVGNNGIALCSLALAAATFVVNLYYKRKEYARQETQSKERAAVAIVQPERTSDTGIGNAPVAKATTKRVGVRRGGSISSVSTGDSKPIRKSRGRKPSQKS